MARVREHHIDMTPTRRSYTQIPFEKYTDGRQFDLLRGEDWSCKTASQVLDMVDRFAKRTGVPLRGKVIDDNTVTVQVVHEKAKEAPAATPEPLRAAVHGHLPADPFAPHAHVAI